MSDQGQKKVPQVPRPAAKPIPPRPAVAPHPPAPPRPAAAAAAAADRAAAVAALVEAEVETLEVGEPSLPPEELHSIDEISVPPPPAAIMAALGAVMPPVAPAAPVAVAPPVAPSPPPAAVAPPPPVAVAPPPTAQADPFAAPAQADPFKAPGLAPRPPPPPATEMRAPPSESKLASEARTHKRLAFEVHLDIVSEHNFYAGLTLNISEGGLFVATHVSHPVGTRLEIRLLFPGDEEPTSLMTEVRWVRPFTGADSSPGMGLRFVDLTPEITEKIGRFTTAREPLYYEDD